MGSGWRRQNLVYVYITPIKQMSRNKSEVLWADWREWQRVHAELFAADDVFAQQRAVSRIAAWRSRGQLPVAINATAQLVEIQLHEHMAQHHTHGIGVSSRSHMELSLMYASSIVRCVNGLVDSSQKGAYAMAVSSLAQRIGIPLWIVDLRHESTHNQLPSLPVLRFAAQHLLAWLRSNYWRRQEELLHALAQGTAELVCARLVQLHAQQDKDDATPKLGDNAALDSDKIRHFAVPLLVTGEQYGERVSAHGLLVEGHVPERLEDSDAYASMEQVVALYPKEMYLTLLLELHAVWPTTGAWLLTCLCRKLLAMESDPDAEVPETDDQEFASECDVELSLLWIKLLTGNDWREKIRFAAEPVDEINYAGAELLFECEERKRVMPVVANSPILDRLTAVLRGCKGIRNHPLLAKLAAINETLDTASKTTGWTKLADWESCPMGLRFVYGDSDIASFAYVLDDDSLVPESESFSVYEEDEEAAAEHQLDAQMDAMMGEWETTYDQNLEQVRSLQQEIVEQVVSQGQSVHHRLLPQQEVRRIQSQIEIW